MKTCSKCNLTKPLSEYYKHKTTYDNRYPNCKECAKDYNKKRYNSSPKKFNQIAKKYRKENANKISKLRKKLYWNDPEKFRKQKRDWALKNPRRVKEIAKKCYYNTKDTRNRESREYQKKHRPKISKQRKEYYKNNKAKLKQYYENNKPNRNKRLKVKRDSDSFYKLKETLRNRINNYFRNIKAKKHAKTEKLLGASWSTVKKHIENQFKKGMNWDNHGQWQIDHIIPLSYAKDIKKLKKIFNYQNLQPLWATENLNKRNKIIHKYLWKLPLKLRQQLLL